jgi:hypothetical protein
MKVTFSNAELHWIHEVLGRLIVAVHKDGSPRSLVRQLVRLRYKFTPNASYVNVKVKERQFLNEILEYRSAKLVGLEGVGPEATMVKDIQTKLGVAP